MTFSDLHIGAVFQTEWDSRPIRVIALMKKWSCTTAGGRTFRAEGKRQAGSHD
jgi:hypothetical protein